MLVLQQWILDDPKRSFILHLLVMTPEQLADAHHTCGEGVALGDRQAGQLMAVADAIGACLHPVVWDEVKGRRQAV